MFNVAMFKQKRQLGPFLITTILYSHCLDCTALKLCCLDIRGGCNTKNKSNQFKTLKFIVTAFDIFMAMLRYRRNQ